MAAELFKIMTGIDVVFVRYRADAQVVTDLLGGQVQVAFGGAWRQRHSFAGPPSSSASPRNSRATIVILR